MSVLSSLYNSNKALRESLNVQVDNASRMNVRGATKQQVHLTTNIVGGQAHGIEASAPTQIIDEQIHEQLRAQQTNVGDHEQLKDLYQFFDELFGQKGQKNTLVHHGQKAMDAFLSLSNDPLNGGADALGSLKSHITKIADLGGRVQSKIETVDSSVESLVGDVNNLLETIAQSTEQIKGLQSTGGNPNAYLDQRRTAIQDLSKMMDIKVIDDANGYFVQMASGETLIRDNVANKVSYDRPTVINPGDTLPDITLETGSNNISITDSLTGNTGKGQLSSVLKFQRKTLPALQNQFDQYAKNFRDEINRIHNQGIPPSARKTLTGTIGAPSTGYDIVNNPIPLSNPVEGTTLLNGAGISATGTLRIAVFNYDNDPASKDGGKVSASDTIDLSTVTTVQDLVDRVNGTGFATASITADGRFQIGVDSTNARFTDEKFGITLGTVKDSEAKITHDGKDYSPSHFFGLNNLIDSPNVNTGTLQPGLAQTLTINSVIDDSKGNLLSIGRLSQDTTLDPNKRHLDTDNFSIPKRLSELYSNERLNFEGTDTLSGRTVSLKEYASSIVDIHFEMKEQNEKALESEKSILETLSTEAGKLSKITPQEVLMNVTKLQQDMLILQKILGVIRDLDQRLIDI